MPRRVQHDRKPHMPVRKRMALFIASLASLLLLINFHLEPPVEPVRAPVEVQGPHMAYDDSSQPLTGDPTDTIRETGHERPGAQVINFRRTGTDFWPSAHEQVIGCLGHSVRCYRMCIEQAHHNNVTCIHSCRQPKWHHQKP